jgi:putative DNA primase/helicase
VRWRDDVLTVKLRAIDAARERQKLAMKIPDDDLREDYLRWLKGSESTGRVRSALELAECHLVKQIYEFDADPFSLCCTNGVINLKNGNFRPAIPEDMLHRSTNVRYNPAAECPRWIQFLSEIFGCNDSVTRGWKSDTDLISFIQKAVGYTLTGSVEEQCLFINYGTGENGKTTFLGIIEKLLGEFSSTLLSDTLKEHKHDNQIPNDSQPIGSPGSWI